MADPSFFVTVQRSEMATCWAAPLGDCDEKISREHIVSAGLWSGPTVRAIGLPWCPKEGKEVGVAALTAKVLCRKHNSLLSPADTAAQAAFRVLHVSTDLGNRRNGQRPRKWRRVRLEVDGPLLERWFVKTAINLAGAAKTNMVWHHDGSPAGMPGPDLVDWAFGVRPLARPFGLYAAASLGETIFFSEYLTAAPVQAQDGKIAAYVFRFRGLRFFVALADIEVPPVIAFPNSDEPVWQSSQLVHHVQYVNFRVGAHISHYVDFMWPGRRPWSPFGTG